MLKVTPEDGPMTATLDPRPPLPKDPTQIIRGRVVDHDGNPLKDVEVSRTVVRLKRGVSTTRVPGMETLCFTDSNGDFLFAAPEPIDSANLVVAAPLQARKSFSGVRSGGELQTLQVSTGATVRGRITRNGRPASGVALGMLAFNDVDLGETTIGSNDDGLYEFTHIGPGQYTIVGKHDSLERLGCTRATVVTVAGDNSTVEADPLEIVPGLTLSGKLVLNPVPTTMPPDSHLVINRRDAWDSITLVPAADGSFSLEQLAPAPYDIIVRVPGYRLTTENPNLEWLLPHKLSGRLTHELHDLQIRLESGKELASSNAHEGRGLQEFSNPK